MDHPSLVEGIHPSSYPGAMSGTRLPKPLSASLSGRDPALGQEEGKFCSGEGMFEQQQGEVRLVCKHRWEQEG